MSKIYAHFSDKSIVLDSSENFLYPLFGSLLRWDNLRVALSLSVTQSTSDDNYPLTFNEVLPMNDGGPLLNRFSIGLKTKNSQIVGEAGCNFIGLSNGYESIGSSIGFYEGSPLVSHSKTYQLPVLLNWTGANYLISGESQYIGFSTPFSNSGTTYVPQVGSAVNFNGNILYLGSSLTNGQTGAFFSSPVPVSLTTSDIRGILSGQSVLPMTYLGCSIGETDSYYEYPTFGKSLQLPVPNAMTSNSQNTSVLILDFAMNNRGNLGTQTVKVGMQVIKGQTDTSYKALETLIAGFTPTIETSYLSYSATPPTAIYVRWPFQQTRLRIHSLVAKKV